MRKSQFKSKAQKGLEKRGYNEISCLYFFRASQYRWVDGETADPQYGDITYHLTEKAAINEASKIVLEIGFFPIVDKMHIEYSDFNEGIEFGEEFELEDLDNYKKFNSLEEETIYTGPTNNGGELPENGVIVYYQHHTYLNYAYNIIRVELVTDSRQKTFADLRNDADSTSSVYAFVCESVDELAEAFVDRKQTPFDKMNKGQKIVSEFLAEQGHPDYTTNEE